MGKSFAERLRGGRLIEAIGAWPFDTRKTFHLPRDGALIVHSRHLRKGLLHGEQALFSAVARVRCWLWNPSQLNWWIGGVFAVGSLLFALGSILCLAPGWARVLSLDAAAVNAIFFAGSIPFTTAAYLQVYQSANAPSFAAPEEGRPIQRRFFGWRPREAGWLACVLQFAGTLLFNLNTFDAIDSALNWRQQDWLIWLPDFLGSVLFLISGYLFFLEVAHAYWAWQPRSLSWCVNFANLLGCVAFMASACFAYVPSDSPGFPIIAAVFTLLGAAGFFIGSALMLPEAAPVPSPG